MFFCSTASAVAAVGDEDMVVVAEKLPDIEFECDGDDSSEKVSIHLKFLTEKSGTFVLEENCEGSKPYGVYTVVPFYKVYEGEFKFIGTDQHNCYELRTKSFTMATDKKKEGWKAIVTSGKQSASLRISRSNVRNDYHGVPTDPANLPEMIQNLDTGANVSVSVVFGKEDNLEEKGEFPPITWDHAGVFSLTLDAFSVSCELKMRPLEFDGFKPSSGTFSSPGWIDSWKQRGDLLQKDWAKFKMWKKY